MLTEYYTIIKKSNWTVTEWSGGTTSQLFIHPIGSNFKTGDYKLRISIATVEVESSIFTPLKDVNRTLLVLDGQLKLNHEDHHSSSLAQFDQDSFSGNWKTDSIGKVRDFNVMTKGHTHSVVRTFIVSKDTELATIENDFIHILNGKAKIGNKPLQQSDSIAIRAESSTLLLLKNTRVILVRTTY